jgi:hypothetical protein
MNWQTYLTSQLHLNWWAGEPNATHTPEFLLVCQYQD